MLRLPGYQRWCKNMVSFDYWSVEPAHINLIHIMLYILTRPSCNKVHGVKSCAKAMEPLLLCPGKTDPRIAFSHHCSNNSQLKLKITPAPTISGMPYLLDIPTSTTNDGNITKSMCYLQTTKIRKRSTLMLGQLFCCALERVTFMPPVHFRSVLSKQ